MLSIHGVDEVKAAAMMFAKAPAETRKAIQKESRAWAPTLKQAAQSRARGRMQNRIANSGKITVTGNGLKATFGASGKASHGTSLGEVTRPFEFGTDTTQAYTEYLSRHRVTRRAMRVKRRTKKGLPHRDERGHFIYPAVADATPKLVARYVRAIAQAVTRGG